MSSLFLKISFLLSPLEPTIRHFCFEQKNDVILPVYSEYSVPQSRMLGIHSLYSRIENETQSNGYLGLFHLFLFWNKVYRTHPKFDYDFQTATNTTTLLIALLYCNNGVVLLTGWSYMYSGVPRGSVIERAMLF